jgi:recombination protein RecT
MGELVQRPNQSQTGAALVTVAGNNPIIADIGRSMLRADNIGRIRLALPKGQDPRRFAHSVLAALERTPKLIECTPESLGLAVMEAAHLGLPVDGARGFAYLLPFYNGKKKCTEATLILGYKGMVHLAQMSAHISSARGEVVVKGDFFDWEKGLSPNLKHKPKPGNLIGTNDRGNPVYQDDNLEAAYAVARLAKGSAEFEVMYKDEVDLIRSRSPGKNSPAWVKYYPEMAKKTVLRRLMKWVGLGDDRIARAIDLDERFDANAGQDLGAGLSVEVRDVARTLIPENATTEPPPLSAEEQAYIELQEAADAQGVSVEKYQAMQMDMLNKEQASK